jgi:hypothetical protein
MAAIAGRTPGVLLRPRVVSGALFVLLASVGWAQTPATHPSGGTSGGRGENSTLPQSGSDVAMPANLAVGGSLAAGRRGIYSPSSLSFSSAISAGLDGIDFLKFVVPGHSGFSAISGGGIVPASATTWQNNGITGIMESYSGSSSVNTVGVYGQCVGRVTNALCWGLNSVVDDVPGTSQKLEGAEIDVGVNGKPWSVLGIQIAGNGTGTLPSNSYAIEVGKTAGSWNYGLNFDDGSTHTAIVIPALSTRPRAASAPILFRSYNSAGALIGSYLSTDSKGDLNYTSSAGDSPALKAPVLSAGDGSHIVYRCTAAGALPVGALTVSTKNCRASADTGLRVK